MSTKQKRNKKTMQEQLQNQSIRTTLVKTFTKIIVATIVIVLSASIGFKFTKYTFSRLVNGPITLNRNISDFENSFNKQEIYLNAGMIKTMEPSVSKEFTLEATNEAVTALEDFQTALVTLNDARTSELAPNIEALNKLINQYKEMETVVFKALESGNESEAYKAYVEVASDIELSVHENLATIHSVLDEKQATYIIRVNSTATFISGLLFVILVIITIVSYKNAKTVSKYIIDTLKHLITDLKTIENGNLHQLISIDGNNEFVELANSMNETVSRIGEYITEEEKALALMAQRDMTASIDTEFIGDFAPMKEAVNDISSKYNEFLLSTKTASVDVTAAANDMANISQSLADASQTQSGSIEELLAVIENLNNSIRKIADNATHMCENSRKDNDMVQSGNEKMHELVSAMAAIETTSNEISGITSMIEEISRQTNLLSLNASIEAARAGEQGRGFAIVAGEIRTLADASAEASRKISTLIAESLHAVNNGTVIANDTASLFETITENGVNHVVATEEISKECISQADTLNSVVAGVQDIAETTTNNSALAQEASATSEELLASAETLTSELEKFKLRNA